MKFYKAISLSLTLLSATTQVDAILPSELEELDAFYRSMTTAPTPDDSEASSSSSVVQNLNKGVLFIGDQCANYFIQPQYSQILYFCFLNKNKEKLKSAKDLNTDEDKVQTLTLENLESDLQALIERKFKFYSIYVDATLLTPSTHKKILSDTNQLLMPGCHIYRV